MRPIPNVSVALQRHSPLLRPRMPELDALRGVAVLAVVLYHGFFWAHWRLSGAAGVLVRLTEPGWAGVDLFFVLSGFLITGILLDARGRPDYFRGFYRRRVLRIWPAYFALLGLLAVTSQIGLPFALASTFFLANLCALLGIPMQYGPLWSLAVEEQFYLVWPLLARFASRRVLATVAIAILALGPLLRYATFLRVGPVYALAEVEHRTWLHLDGLAMGALLAVFLRSRLGSRQNLAVLAGVLAASLAALALIASRLGALARVSPGGAALLLGLLSGAAVVLVSAVLLLGTSRFRSLVLLPPLRFLGDISYGLYLLHVLAFMWYDRIAAAFAPGLLGDRTSPALLLLRFLLAAGFSIALATLSRRHFEERFLRLGRPGGSARPVPGEVEAAAA